MPADVLVWLNGRLYQQSEAKVSVYDHSFLYGDGIYETIGIWDNQFLFLAEHLARFARTARAVKLQCPSMASLTSALRKTRVANHLSDGALRITLSRGEGPLGLNPAVCPKPTLVIQPHPSRNRKALVENGLMAGIVHIRRLPKAVLDPALKTNSMLPLVLARAEGVRLGWDESILLNMNGELAEGTTTNVFWFEGTRLVTPALSCGILPGVMRAHVLKIARRKRVPAIEGHFRPDRLTHASELFLTNSTLGILPVRNLRISGRTRLFQIPGPQTTLLLNSLSS